MVPTICCRPRGPEHPVHRRVRRRQDREHQESDSVSRLRGRLQAQDCQPPSHHGKSPHQHWVQQGIANICYLDQQCQYWYLFHFLKSEVIPTFLSMHFSWLVVWSVFSTARCCIIYCTSLSGQGSATFNNLWLSWRWWRHKYLLILIPPSICVFYRPACEASHGVSVSACLWVLCSVAVIIFRSLQSLAAPCNCSGCSSCKSLILSFCKHFYLPGICRDFLRPWIWMFEPLFKCNNFVTTP